MSHFTGLLRQISKKASHPNALVYKVQLERAKQKYLVQGQLGDAEGAVMLDAPESKMEAGENEAEAEGGEGVVGEQRGGTESVRDDEEGHGESPGPRIQNAEVNEDRGIMKKRNGIKASETAEKELPGGSVG